MWPKRTQWRPGWTVRTHLDAVLIKKTRHGETPLLIQGFAENNNLLKKEDSSLLHPAQQATIRVRHHKGVLQKESTLSHDLPLKDRIRTKLSSPFDGRRWNRLLVHIVRSFILTKHWLSYLKSLQTSHIHHVIASLRDNAHDLNRFL